MRTLVAIPLLGASLVLIAGCNGGALPGGAGDLSTGYTFPVDDMSASLDDLTPIAPCSDGDPDCHHALYGPPAAPFPLQSDPMPDELEQDEGLDRDPNGYLVIDASHFSFYYLWVPNTHDLNEAGTISKLDSQMVREVARYLSVTCYSLVTGSTVACDGTNGCCSMDDYGRYAARVAKQAQPGHQEVQQIGGQPSRTSVDFNGDLFVANIGQGIQASVSKIANDPSECVDRNKNGQIDTSHDANANGWIDMDCNGDGVPDDLAGVKAKPCVNGQSEEFFGADDECILWTTNIAPGASLRALSLAAGAQDSNVSDAWATSSLGQSLCLDGVGGTIKQDAVLPNDCTLGTGPWGSAVDSSGIAWVTEKSVGKLCYFDTKKPGNTGVVRDPQWGPMQGDGLTLDRDQNLWVGGSVARYTPDRSNGFANLGAGWWTGIQGTSGIGIAADSRNANAYFVYSCAGANVLQIPASNLKILKMDQQLANPGWPTVNMPCFGVGTDADQNLWGIDRQNSTRALIDNVGKITQPNLHGMPMGNNVCPVGDLCPNLGAEVYSDFAEYPLRGFTNPQSSYSLLVQGCTDGAGNPASTEWWSITWDADVPPTTTLTVLARSANSSDPNDPGWGSAMWTKDEVNSPLDLQSSLSPNQIPGGPAGKSDGWLQLEFIFKTEVDNATPTPTLKSIDVAWRCESLP